MPKKIKILDTTLRDGDQAPGFHLMPDEKVKMAYQLEKLGVDIIEAGFPFASDGEFKAVKEISNNIRSCTIGALCRARKEDIDRGWEAVKDAEEPLINMFIPISDLHLEFVLHKTRKEILRMSIDAVKYARDLCNKVEFTAVDCSRTEPDFVIEFFAAIVEAGATTIGVPDTVGYLMPEEYGKLIRTIKDNVPEIENVTVAAHCHNDLGMAVANSLAAIKNGAGQLECTINGIGERAGNASLEEIVMALVIRKSHFEVKTGINITEIYPASKLLTELTGSEVQRNKPIVGLNAFSHDAGVHLDGYKKNPLTYEILSPEMINAPRPEVELGKYSGRTALKIRLANLGFNPEPDILNEIYKQFIKLTEIKKVIEDDDLKELIKTVSP